MANPKGGVKNLKPLNTRPKEEQRAIQLKGGYARGAQMKRECSIQDILKAWAKKPIVPQKLKEQAEAFGLDTDEGRALLALGMLQNAMNGNSKYLDRVLAMLGEDNPAADIPDDGFVSALNASAAEDWGDTDV